MQGMMMWVTVHSRAYGGGLLWLDDEPPSFDSIVFVCETEHQDYLMIASSDMTNFIPVVIEDMSHIDYVFYSNTLKSTGRRDRGEQIKFNSILELEPLVTKLKEDDNDLC